MKQVVRRQDTALDQPVRLMAYQSVPVFGGLAGKLRVNDGMTHGVLAVLIDPRVQRREIVVEDVLVRLGLTVGSDCFGPSAGEGLAGIQGVTRSRVLAHRRNSGSSLFWASHSHSHFSTTT